MQVKKTLRFGIILTYSLVVALFSGLLMYNNTISTDMLRQQQLAYSLDANKLYLGKVGVSLDDLRNYLIITLNQNQDLFISPTSAQDNTTRDYPRLQRIQQLLDRDRVVHSMADLLFYYSPQSGDYITSARTQLLYEDSRSSPLSPFTGKEIERIARTDAWRSLQIGDEKGIFRMLTDGTGNYLGAWISLKNMFTFENSPTSDTRSRQLLLSNDGHLLLGEPVSLPLLNRLKDIGLQDMEQSFTFKDPESRQTSQVVAIRPKKMDLLHVSIQEEGEALSRISLSRLILLQVPAAAILALALFLLLLRRLLFKPIDVILSGLEKVASGDLSVQIPQRGIGELQEVAASFNEMVHRIKSLQIDVRDGQIREKEALLHTQEFEMKLLQLQINPHFLSNSLSIIHNLTLVNDSLTIRDLSLLMSRYFRYTMRIRSPWTTLSQDLSFVTDYLAIQKIRFTRRLEFQVEDPGELGPLRSPPMIVQPFVENSIIHSMVDLEDPMMIRVRAERAESGHLQFFIRDNGCGFPGAMLEDLNHSEISVTAPDVHTGIWNVRYRLRLLYGDEAQIHFENPLSGGALVLIRIPLLAEETLS